MSPNKAIGVLNVEHDKLGGLTDNDRELLTTIANLASIALYNVDQYEEALAMAEIAKIALSQEDLQHTIDQKAFAVRGYIDLLKELDQSGNKILDGILKEMGNIIQELQSVALHAPPSDTSTIKLIAIDPFIADLIKPWQATYPRVQFLTSWQCPRKFVFLNSRYLKIALQKLIQNAVEKMTNGGTLKIETYLISDRFVTIALEDSGPGIPHDYQAIIGRQTIPKEFSKTGSGRGALIAAVALREYGGDLKLAWTEKGKGTRLEISLPVWRDEPETT